MASASNPQITFYYQGQPAASGSVYVYQTGTTTPVTVYSDGGLTTPITNPINLDANGQCKFYVSGTVNLRMDAYTGLAGAGSLIESLDPVYPSGYTSGVASNTNSVSGAIGIVSLNAQINIYMFNTASVAGSMQLPTAVGSGKMAIIKDSSGNASNNNITITVTADGGSSLVINNNYQSITLAEGATTWSIVG